MKFGTLLLGAAVGGVYAAVTGGDVMKSALWGGGIGGALTLIGGASVSLGRARMSVSGGGDYFAGVDPMGNSGGVPTLPTAPAMPVYDPATQPQNAAPADEFRMPAGYPWWSC